MRERSGLNGHTFVRLTAMSLWENLPMVLFSGFVFALLCTPAVLLFMFGLVGPGLIVGVLSVSPAWAALLAIEAEIVRDTKTSIRVMLRALPRYWTRSAGLGLVGSFPLLAAFFTLPFFAQPTVLPIAWLGLGADALGMLVLITLFLYAFPLLVLYDLDLHTMFRNALVLASRHIVNTLGLLGMGVLFAFAVFYVSPGLVFILPAVWGFFIVNNCRMVVEGELADE